MAILLERGLQQVRQFYIEKLIKTGIYPPNDKELNYMTISELKNIYMQEAAPKNKRTQLLVR